MNFRSLVFLALVSRAVGVEPPIPPTPDKQPEPPFPPSQGGAPQMLVPGFQVRELPIAITSINNVEYAADGRLFAGGYDGRFHLLRDTDSDGLEDQVVTFSPEESSRYPLGLVVKDGVPHAVLTDEIVRFLDTDGDGIPDKRETVVKGFDDPALSKLPYLNYRRVDSSLALAIGPDGAIYVTMGNAGYSNPYWHDGALPVGGKAAGTVGTAHYSTDKRRGCLLRITPDGKVEQLSSGLRYIMGLQFNRFGDLFGTDQEGATWSPNGNPFDELLHIQAGRHYGFPPRHPEFLPDVIDEPSVWDYAPQHQSTCGFRFNGPSSGRGRFGPGFWSDDAIVTGESRGRLWRTKLAKTAAGYVARTDLFARTGLLPVDCAISPQGDLLVSCHTGKPDWGNGPKGAGRLFKISFADKSVPQPVIAWAAGESETIVAFDRPLDGANPQDIAAQTTMISGRFIDAAERLETIRPGYAVVQMQQREKPVAIAVKSARLGEDRRSIHFETAPRAFAVNYAFTMNQPDNRAIDAMHDLSGVAVEWTPGNSGPSPNSFDHAARWLPHPDFAAAREFTRGSALHDELWKQLAQPGTLSLRGNLDLWKMLIPVTQPGSDLGYTPELEVVTVIFKSDSAIRVYAPGVKVEQEETGEARITVTPTGEGRYQPFTATLTTPAKSLDVSFHTKRDPRPRALGTRRFLVPFAKAVLSDAKQAVIPEIAGGNWEAGRELFKGKALCATCHQLRGEGVQVGPDLGNLVHRDYASVLIDIADPSAAINPDAAGYSVTLRNGSTVIGARLGESPVELQIAQAGGSVVKLKKSEIAKTDAMTASLMPPGLDKLLTAAELRDLMTYLLTERASASAEREAK